MNDKTCGCCEGIEKLTPLVTANRPGLDMLSYRAGTHASFLETMIACLSSSDYPELAKLTTRLKDDPSIALLDAWAIVADVLTFYQERIANEGYLRTATERRSILELARLIGYKLQPGVSASVYLAFTLEDGYQVEIPEGAGAKSLPGPGETPQTFETSKPLLARTEWNVLKPRMSKPQTITLDDEETLFFKGTSTDLKLNDPIIVGDDFGDLELYRVGSVKADKLADHTWVEITKWQIPTNGNGSPSGETMRAMPEALRASALKAFVDGLHDVGKLNPNELLNLVEKFANNILETFKVIAEMPQSELRDKVIKETQETIESFKTKIETIRDNLPQNSNLYAYLNKVLDWIAQAISILEKGITTIPAGVPVSEKKTSPGELVNYMLRPKPIATIPPKSSIQKKRDIKTTFSTNADTGNRVLLTLHQSLQPLLYPVLRNATVTDQSSVKVYALRSTASLFGYNVPKQVVYGVEVIHVPNGEDITYYSAQPPETWPEWERAEDEASNVIYLDSVNDKIGIDSYIAIKTGADAPLIYNSTGVETLPRTAYGISAKTTKITLNEGWWDPEMLASPDITPDEKREKFENYIRPTTVYVQSEELDLSEKPIEDSVAGNSIELDGLYDGLQSGRWAILSGERVDLPGTSGIYNSELLMISGVEEKYNENLKGDKNHSTIFFDNDLAYSYKRDTVKIYANVVKATHGETQTEVLGSGDAAKSLQQFALKKSPLTYLAASTPSGIKSTLETRVNNVLWDEKERLNGLKATDRVYITRTDNDDITTLTFGNGRTGALLPTGIENIKAVYRAGIGKPGNVAEEQISLLAKKPLGVKSVINPLRASGGGDREGRDQGRRNAPLAVMALDRLVSIQDYADFARTFAGIGKASAALLTDGRRRVVHITIAGADDIPIDKSSDLYQNLYEAFHKSGDPFQPIQIEVRELWILVISANVRVLPEYLWEFVEPEIRSALLDTFSFDRRDFGQDVTLSEVISVIQSIPGVAYADVDLLDGISEEAAEDADKLEAKFENLTKANDELPKKRIVVEMDRIEEVENGNLPKREIKPAQLAYLSPDVTDTLILNEIN